MTTRYLAFTVALEQDIREDDAQAIMTALRMVKGVASVVPVEANPAAFTAELRVRTEMGSLLYDVARAVMAGHKVTIEPEKAR